MSQQPSAQPVEKLCTACWDNQLDVVREVIRANPKILNTPNSRGQNALYCACHRGHLEVVVELLNTPGIDVNLQVSSHGGTALHAACFYDHPEIVLMLLLKGADTNIVNHNNMVARQEAKPSVIDGWGLWASNAPFSELSAAYPALTSLRGVCVGKGETLKRKSGDKKRGKVVNIGTLLRKERRQMRVISQRISRYFDEGASTVQDLLARVGLSRPTGVTLFELYTTMVIMAGHLLISSVLTKGSSLLLDFFFYTYRSFISPTTLLEGTINLFLHAAPDWRYDFGEPLFLRGKPKLPLLPISLSPTSTPDGPTTSADSTTPTTPTTPNTSSSQSLGVETDIGSSMEFGLLFNELEQTTLAPSPVAVEEPPSPDHTKRSNSPGALKRSGTDEEPGATRAGSQGLKGFAKAVKPPDSPKDHTEYPGITRQSRFTRSIVVPGASPASISSDPMPSPKDEKSKSEGFTAASPPAEQWMSAARASRLGNRTMTAKPTDKPPEAPAPIATPAPTAAGSLDSPKDTRAGFGNLKRSGRAPLKNLDLERQQAIDQEILIKSNSLPQDRTTPRSPAGDWVEMRKPDKNQSSEHARPLLSRAATVTHDLADQTRPPHMNQQGQAPPEFLKKSSSEAQPSNTRRIRPNNTAPNDFPVVRSATLGERGADERTVERKVLYRSPSDGGQVKKGSLVRKLSEGDLTTRGASITRPEGDPSQLPTRPTANAPVLVKKRDTSEESDEKKSTGSGERRLKDHSSSSSSESDDDEVEEYGALVSLEGLTPLEIKFRAVSFLEFWLTRHWDDFAYDPELGKRYTGFSETEVPLSDPCHEKIQNLHNYVLTKTEQDNILKLGSNSNPHPPALRKSKFNIPGFVGPTLDSNPEGTSQAAKTQKKIQLLETPPLKFAKQMTLYHSILFSRIRAHHLIHRPKEPDATDPVHHFISTFNNTSNWIKTVILSETDTLRRRKMIRNSIEICEHLLAQRNFHGAVAMLVGLSSTVVERLKSDSWGENLQSESYNQMKTLVSPMSNFSAYRTWYSKEPNLPAIPQLGIHLSDLLHLSDAVKAQTENGNINFPRFAGLGGLLKEIKGAFELYPGTLEKSFESYFQNLPIVDEDRLYELSLIILPRKPKAGEPEPERPAMKKSQGPQNDKADKTDKIKGRKNIKDLISAPPKTQLASGPWPEKTAIMFREIFRIWIEFTTPNTHVKDSTNQDTPEVHATISQHLNVLMAAKKDFEKQNDLIRMALTLELEAEPFPSDIPDGIPGTLMIHLAGKQSSIGSRPILLREALASYCSGHKLVLQSLAVSDYKNRKISLDTLVPDIPSQFIFLSLNKNIFIENLLHFQSQHTTKLFSQLIRETDQIYGQCTGIYGLLPSEIEQPIVELVEVPIGTDIELASQPFKTTIKKKKYDPEDAWMFGLDLNVPKLRESQDKNSLGRTKTVSPRERSRGRSPGRTLPPLSPRISPGGQPDY